MAIQAQVMLYAKALEHELEGSCTEMSSEASCGNQVSVGRPISAAAPGQRVEYEYSQWLV